MTTTLHHEPFRHYKMTNPETGKVTWNGANKQRIVSVTTVLDGVGGLVNWATGATLHAAEDAAATFLDADRHLAGSLLSFGQLAYLTGRMPDQIKRAAGDEGTAVHTYVSERLSGRDGCFTTNLPYGLRVAIEAWIAEHRPEVIIDGHGPQVERAVGCFERAIAGTYDLHARLADGYIHRVDFKSGNTVQPTAFAQLATYERMAAGLGEDVSDLLTVVHVDRCGNFEQHSIEVGSIAEEQAHDLFDAYLTIHRTTPSLAKHLKKADAP